MTTQLLKIATQSLAGEKKRGGGGSTRNENSLEILVCSILLVFLSSPPVR
jgi:hypothetical protein